MGYTCHMLGYGCVTRVTVRCTLGELSSKCTCLFGAVSGESRLRSFAICFHQQKAAGGQLFALLLQVSFPGRPVEPEKSGKNSHTLSIDQMGWKGNWKVLLSPCSSPLQCWANKLFLRWVPFIYVTIKSCHVPMIWRVSSVLCSLALMWEFQRTRQLNSLSAIITFWWIDAKYVSFCCWHASPYLLYGIAKTQCFVKLWVVVDRVSQLKDTWGILIKEYANRTHSIFILFG